MIDHTLLKPTTEQKDVEKLIAEAKEYNFFSVVVNPYWVAFAKQQLKDTDIAVVTVIGFPLGANTPTTKAFEASEALKNGADEVDTVINIGALKNADYQTVLEDIQGVVLAARGTALVKVIIETSYLTDFEIVKACELAKEAGADFVKTSTGFSDNGATVADIALMRKTVGADMGVKASGGVNTLETANAMIEAGATRIGTSSGVKFFSEDYVDASTY